MATEAVVGRDAELARVQALLDRNGPEQLSALLLEGEPGIGKSTVWASGVAAAGDAGFRVVMSRPAEAESDLAHVVIADLLEDAADEVLPALPAPRRHALEAVLLTDRAPDDILDPRALAVAVRTCFELLAGTQPLLVAVDDAQWIDPGSASALAFAFRRLRAGRVALLLARRPGPSGAGGAIDAALDAAAVERLEIGPLSMGAVRVLVQRRLGRSLPRPLLVRLHETSGGNPFYALELARELDSTVQGDWLEQLPVAQTLERLVGARLDGLAAGTLEGLLLAAAHGRPPLTLLEAAGTPPATLAPAVDVGVVDVADGVVRFTHPLLAAAVYRGASRAERMRAHGRLAEQLTDPTERARHLARSSDRPDPAAARIVEDAATVAGARGAIVEAAELADQALRLTPVDAADDRDRRTVVAARAHLRSIDTTRARELAVDLLDRATDGGRATALVLCSDVEDARGDPERAIQLREEALAAAHGLPSLRVETHLWLAQVLPFTDSVAAGDRHAVIALELAEELDDDALRVAALGTMAWGRYRAGVPGALELVDRALDLVHPGLDASLRRDLALGAVNSLVWSHELDRARSLVEAVDAEWSERDELGSAEVQWCLGKIALHAGRFDEAADHAARAREIRQQYMPDERELAGLVWLVALIAVHRGELDRARELVELNRPAAQRSIDRSGDDGVLGLVELWGGNPSAAVELFEAADVERRTNGVDEPAMFWWRADYVEALLALGRIDEAEIVLDAWEGKATELGRNAVLAPAARCRGLVAAARADVDGSLAQLERAGALHEAVGDPFGQARALLALGTIRRRARRRTAAREALTAALAGFAACGAANWAAKARAELGSIGGRTRVAGLTPAEGRIATLVSEGHTNREVAATLFLTERTVATALTRIYGKLGVRSRTELALALSRGRREEEERAKT